MEIIRFVLISYLIQEIYAIITNNPIKLNEKKYPFVLPYSDDNYYYVITTESILKVDKSSEYFTEIGTNSFDGEPLYCSDNSNNSYLFLNKSFYNISNPFDDKKQITSAKTSDSLNVEYIGCIQQDNDFIIYTAKSGQLIFLSLSQNNHYGFYSEGLVDEKISCKFIENENFICSGLFSNKIKIIFTKYSINTSNKYFNLINTIPLDDGPTQYISTILYDTPISTTLKILCKQKNDKKIIFCSFINVTISDSGSGNIEYLRNQINIEPFEQELSENDCSFSEFIGEYLFCCGIKDHILCFRINYDLTIIKEFKIHSKDKNNYLSIKTDNNCATIIFMNNENEVHEYKIYVPECNNKTYTFKSNIKEIENIG